MRDFYGRRASRRRRSDGSRRNRTRQEVPVKVASKVSRIIQATDPRLWDTLPSKQSHLTSAFQPSAVGVPSCSSTPLYLTSFHCLPFQPSRPPCSSLPTPAFLLCTVLSLCCSFGLECLLQPAICYRHRAAFCPSLKAPPPGSLPLSQPGPPVSPPPPHLLPSSWWDIDPQ